MSTVLAWIGAVYLALFVCVLAFVALSEVMERVRERRERAAEERSGETTEKIRGEIESRGETTEKIRVEPDPIESYPQPTPIRVSHTLTADPPLPQIGNPLTNRWMTPEIRQ